MSPDKWLDNVAQTLARARSRRDLLKGLAAVFAGTLTAAFPTASRAQSHCVEVCGQFFEKGAEFGRCVADCERGICGPAECAEGTICCNPTCGICVPPGGFCIQIHCGPPEP